MGYIGIAHSIIIAPIIVLCHYADYEKFEWPNEKQTILLIYISLADAAYNVAGIVAVALLDPVIFSLGILLVCPLTFVFDVWYRGVPFTILQIVGSVLVCGGSLFMKG
eukprot:UN27612